MEDLTSKLRRLTTRHPSKSLDERVLGILESQPLASRPLASQSRVPRIGLGWAVAAALLMGAVGFWAGLSQAKAPGDSDRPGAQPGSSPHNVDHSPGSKEIQVVVTSGGAGNPFDFSLPIEVDLVQEWKTEIRLNAGSSDSE